ncbi:MAG: fimbrillin family protein [Rikenellaceae bacterium]
MKRFTLLCSSFLVAALSLNSCQETQTTVEPANTVKFTSEISTRVTGEQFDNGDAIAVFAFENGVLYQGNTMYTYSNGTFSSDTPIELSSDDLSLSYGAAYPYSSDMSSNGSFYINVDQSAEANYEASDLLVACTEATTSLTPQLVFNHAFSKLNITLESETVDLTDAIVEVKAVNCANVSVKDATYTAEGTAVNVRCLPLGDNEYSVIFPPQSVSAQAGYMTIVAGGVEYVWNLSFNFTFESGKSYKSTVSIEAAVEEGDGTIEELNEGVEL